jgi:inosine-uridine nucleoside N-ribohydrolase
MWRQRSGLDKIGAWLSPVSSRRKASEMARKLIIDCDPGIDDALALYYALFTPVAEVLAVTAVEGRVDARNASRNVQMLIEQLDPPKFPRIGAASPHDKAPELTERALHGEDGLGSASMAVSPLHQQHPAEKILADTIRSTSDEITIICLGPLTNLARALQREPGLEEQIGRIVIVGGTYNGIGDVTSSAELNMFFDPESARAIFQSRTTKTVIPIDVTHQVAFSLDWLHQLPSDDSRAGFVARHGFSNLFRGYHQTMGRESIPLSGVVGLVASLHPELLGLAETAADVETSGELTTGATVFDRRPSAATRGNLEVAVNIDATGVRDELMRGLRRVQQHIG